MRQALPPPRARFASGRFQVPGYSIGWTRVLASGALLPARASMPTFVLEEILYIRARVCINMIIDSHLALPP